MLTADVAGAALANIVTEALGLVLQTESARVARGTSGPHPAHEQTASEDPESKSSSERQAIGQSVSYQAGGVSRSGKMLSHTAKIQTHFSEELCGRK